MKKALRILIPALCLCAAFIFLGSTAQAKGFDKTKAKKKIKVVYKELDDGFLVTYENKNKVAVKIKATMSFVDFGGTPIKKETQVNNCLGKGNTMALFFKKPTNGSGEVMSYSYIKKSFKVYKSGYKDLTKKLDIATFPELVECKCRVLNLTGKELTGVNLTFVFYDGNNKIISVQQVTPGCQKPSKSVEFMLTYNVAAVPEKVVTYRNWAY